MRTVIAGSRAGLVLALGVVLAACETGTPTASTAGPGAPSASAAQAGPVATPVAMWAAPPNPMELTVAAGLEPETSEHLEFHVHAHLDIFVDGLPVLVPAGIGIDIANPMVRTFTEPDGSLSYGGIEVPCGTPCISPLHTHWSAGIIHTESATPKPNTLGQFFLEWGQTLSDSCVTTLCEDVAFYVNGQPYTGDPAAIELADRTEIAIVVGTPPATIPSTADFSLP